MQLFKIAVISTVLAFASAKCPNDCSGHGSCNIYSACECYRNWMAADCSERVCYYGHAFVDTPQGDLNSDGRLDLKSNAYHIILGSNVSFFNNAGSANVETNLGYHGRSASGTGKSKFTFSATGVEYFVEDDITSEYEINVSDTYGYTDACNDKFKAAGPGAPSNDEAPTIKYTIAFEVTGVASGVTEVTAATAADCALGDEVRSYTGDTADCNGPTVGTIAIAANGAVQLVDILPDVTLASTKLACCLAVGGTAKDLGAYASHTAIFPDTAVPLCFGYDTNTGTAACEATEVIFTGDCMETGNCLTTAATTHTIAVDTRIINVCAITPATYNVQWSNQNEWEAYPSEHGVARSRAKNGWDEGHFYRECSNKGVCNRGTGTCECFAGYEGEGCTRTKCLNDCSGHGKCKRAVDIDSTYAAWDAYKSQQCVCDGGYTGVDCSLRVCPSGDDPVTRMDDKNEIQKFGVANPAFIMTKGLTAKAVEAFFALEYTTELGEKFTTRSIDFLHHDVANLVEDALESLPNKVIEDVEVSLAQNGDGNPREVSVTFAHNSGDIPMLKARYEWYINEGGGVAYVSRNKADGSFSSTPKGLTISSIINGNKENDVCSNRGICDYTTGLCKCFGGFTDFDCSVQNALATA